MNNTKGIRNGVTYTLNGEHVEIRTADSTNRVRIMRTARAKGATDITVYTNGRSLVADWS